MLIRIEFYRYEEDLALYNEKEIGSNELTRQLVEAEKAEGSGKEDNFLEVMGKYGWKEIPPEGCPKYWYDRDVWRLMRYNEETGWYDLLGINFEKLIRRAKKKDKRKGVVSKND